MMIDTIGIIAVVIMGGGADDCCVAVGREGG